MKTKHKKKRISDQGWEYRGSTIWINCRIPRGYTGHYYFRYNRVRHEFEKLKDATNAIDNFIDGTSNENIPTDLSLD